MRLKNHSTIEFYDRLSDVVRYSYSRRATFRRLQYNRHPLTQAPRWMNVVRSVASLPRGGYYTTLSHLFSTDTEFRAFDGREAKAPRFFRQAVRAEMGRFYDHLAPGIRAYLEAPA